MSAFSPVGNQHCHLTHSLRLQFTACIGISIITRIIIIISPVPSSAEMSASLNLLLRLFIPPIDLLSPLWVTAFLYANKDTNGSVDTLVLSRNAYLSAIRSLMTSRTTRASCLLLLLLLLQDRGEHPTLLGWRWIASVAATNTVVAATGHYYCYCGYCWAETSSTCTGWSCNS